MSKLRIAFIAMAVVLMLGFAKHASRSEPRDTGRAVSVSGGFAIGKLSLHGRIDMGGVLPHR